MKIMIFGTCLKIKEIIKGKNNLYRIQLYGLIKRILEKVCLSQKVVDEKLKNYLFQKNY